MDLKKFFCQTIAGMVNKVGSFQTKSGHTIYTFDVAVNRYLDGNKETQWFKCSSFDDHGVQAKDKVRVTGYFKGTKEREWQGKTFTDNEFEVAMVDVLDSSSGARSAPSDTVTSSTAKKVTEPDDIEF